MAPSLPSCISSTFCSHRQASWFVLVALIPFFFPLLILCVPFLLLFLAPVSCLLFSLFLLYKVPRPKHLCFVGRTAKGASNKGCQLITEELSIHPQFLSGVYREERKHGVLPEFDSDVQSAEFRSDYEAGGTSSVTDSKGEKQEDTEASSVSDSKGEKQEDAEMLPIHDGMTEQRTEEKQEEQDIIEGTIPPLLEEDREARMHGDFLEHEGPFHSIIQGVELLASYKAPVEAKGLQILAPCGSGESVSDFTKQKQEEPHIHLPPPSKGDTEERKHDLDVQSAESRSDYEARGECVLPSVSDPKGEKQEDTEALPTHDGMQEDMTEEKQEEHAIIEGTIPHLLEGKEERTHGDFQEHEGPFHSIVQGVELLASYKAPVEAKGSQNLASCGSPERVSDFRKQKQEDNMEEKLEEKQEEEEIIEDSMASKDTPKHLSLYEEPTSSEMYAPEDEISAWLPSARENESLHSPLEAPYIHHHHGTSVPCEHERGKEALEDGKEKVESSHVCPMEAWRELPGNQPDSQAEIINIPCQIIEEPWKDACDKGFEINTQEHPGQELELSSDKELSLENLDFAITQKETQEERSSIEPFEKEIQEAEQSCILPEGVSEWRKEAFAKDTQEDAQPQKGRPAKELVETFDTGSQVEREEGYPCETSSVALPPPHVPHGAVEFQDKIQEEQKILADINDIKKIVGYQGEPHASIMEQVSALYTFLGMEPYDWSVEVEYFERVRAEIELLKVVVGVK